VTYLIIYIIYSISTGTAETTNTVHNHRVQQASQPKMNPSYILGLCFIFLVSIIWSLSSILVQYLYQSLNFSSPFLLTYIGTSLFIILIPSRLLWERRKWIQSLIRVRSNGSTRDGTGTGTGPDSNHDYSSRSSTSISGSDLDAVEMHPVTIPWTNNQLTKTTRTMSNLGQGIDSNRGLGQLQYQNGIIVGEASLDRKTRLSPTSLERRNRSRSSSPICMEDLEREIALDAESTRLTSPISSLSLARPELPTTSYLLSHQDHIQMAIKIAPLWFISNYFYNLSLAYTTITSSTVLSSTGSVFTFVFSLNFGDEKFTKWKVLGVSMAFAGSLITALQDASNFEDNDSDVFRHQLWGDAAGLISAVGYGGYTVLVRVLCPEDENRMSMQLFLGYIGLINMTLLSPFLLWVIPGLNGTDGLDQNYNQQDQDQNDVPYYPTQQFTAFVFFCLVVKGLFDNVLSDYLWARSIILTSATVATVGVGLTIPLALISDVFVMGRADIMSFGNIVGAMLVLLGFVFVNIGEGGNDGDREEPALLLSESSQMMYEVV